MEYGVVIYPEKSGNELDWVARFPGVPELKHCIGVGKTPQEALKEAYGNLDAILESLRNDGLPIPASTTYQKIEIPFFMPISAGAGAFATAQ